MQQGGSVSFETWYNFLVQQLAAECYLDGNPEDLPSVLLARLRLGNNDIRPVDQIDVQPQPNQLIAPGSPYYGATEQTGILPGASRFTRTMALEFMSRYQVLDQRKNDASGFSATLLYDTVTHEYTLAMRSTESSPQSKGGDGELDKDGADSEIGWHGF